MTHASQNNESKNHAALIMAWWLLLLCLCVFFVFNRSFFVETWGFVWKNPAFPLVKGKDAPPYSIGLFDSMLFSTCRVLIGSCTGFSIGVIMGLVLSQIPYLGGRIHLLSLFFAPLTPIVWLPILMSVFGTSNVTAILIVASASVFICTVVVYHLATHPKQAHTDLIKLMGGNRLHLLQFVIIPSLIPVLLLLFRLTLLGGWAALIAAEMAGVENGLGAMLIMGRSLGNHSLIFMATILTAFVAFILDRAVWLVAAWLVRKRYGAWVFSEGM